MTPGSPTTRPFAHGLAAAAFVATAAVFWIHRIEIPRPETGPSVGDLAGYFYPSAVFIQNALHDGTLPLWNPYSFAGQPYLALHVPAVLYPPQLVLLSLFDPATALALHSILHLATGAFFTWLFARRLGLGIGPSLLAAVVYLLSGPTIMSLQFTAYTATQTWFPAMLWAIHGLASEARPRWAVAFAIVVALAFLGGHAQGFFYEAQLGALYGIFALFAVSRSETRWRVVGLAALGGVLATAFVAPQLLPAFELAVESVRGVGGLPYPHAAMGHILGTAIARGILAPSWRGAGAVTDVVLYAASWPLLGALLALAGIASGRHRLHWAFFTLATVLVAMYMMGPETPVFRLHYSYLLGKLFRSPMRIMFAYPVCIGLVVAIGLDAIGERLADGRGRRWVWTACAAVVPLVGIDLYARSIIPPHSQLHSRFPTDPLPGILAPGGTPAPARVFVEYDMNVAPPHLTIKAGMMYGFSMLPDYEPSMPAAYDRYFAAARFGIWHGRLSTLTPPKARSADQLRRLLDLMSVDRYVAPSPVREGPGGAALERFAAGASRTEDGVLVVERREAVPRAYAVRCVEYVATVEQAIAHLLAPGFQPTVEAVVVGNEADHVVAPTAPAACSVPSADAEDQVAIVAAGHHTVAIDATCGETCLLVLTDLDYPGWRVWIDGRRREIVKTNAIFRGVWLEPGRHTVEFRFVPVTFWLGVALALAAVAGTVAIAGVRTATASRRAHH
jgi:hypothetical protein